MRGFRGTRLVRLAGAVLPLVLGCAKSVQPARLETSTASAPATVEFTLADALHANRVGRWTYERREPGHESEPTNYVRIYSPERMREGILAERSFLPIERYFRPAAGATTTAPAEPPAPKAPLKGGSAFMFHLTQPLQPIPSDLAMGAARTESTPLIYYNYDGRLLAHGTLTRQVEFEGYETVDCPAGSFRSCPRIRVDLTLQIPWIITMDWTSWLWLSPQAGEVRRLESVSGLFLIFFFSSTHEYTLVSHETAPDAPGYAQGLAAVWTGGGAVLARTVPRPEIAGLVVDFGVPSAALAPASAPARLVTTRPARLAIRRLTTRPAGRLLRRSILSTAPATSAPE